MSLPLITIVPSFFIVMLASPVLSTIESPAVIDQVLAHLQRVVLADARRSGRQPTLRDSSPPIVIAAAAPISRRLGGADRDRSSGTDTGRDSGLAPTLVDWLAPTLIV